LPNGKYLLCPTGYSSYMGMPEVAERPGPGAPAASCVSPTAEADAPTMTAVCSFATGSADWEAGAIVSPASSCTTEEAGPRYARRLSSAMKVKNASAPGLYAEVWEHTEGSWVVTHRFNTGLEFDCRSRSPSESLWSKVHLPSTSLRALQLLSSSLRRPKAVSLDVIPLCDGRGLFETLVDKALDPAAAAERAEAKVMSEAWPGVQQSGREARRAALALEDLDSDEEKVLLEPCVGAEAITVSVCPLRSFDAARPPAVALARLATPLRLGDRPGALEAVRYVALVVCAEDNSIECAREVARAVAVTFMDEGFASSVREVAGDRPADVIAALDDYQSAMTIVPTVYMRSQEAEPEDDSTDYLLSDSLVNSIEKRICRVRGISHRHAQKLHSPHVPCDRHRMEHRKGFFVEVDELVAPSGQWRATRRLRQGLELDAGLVKDWEDGPHLPSVSVAALAHVGKLMTPASVALDAPAENLQIAVDAVIRQLVRAGLPQAAADEAAAALVNRGVNGASGACGGPTASHPSSPSSSAKPVGAATWAEGEVKEDCAKLLVPLAGDEACHVLFFACGKMPPGSSVVGTFVRFVSPLGFCFAPTSNLVRFLLFFVGPLGSISELGALSESIAALTVDEDLMADLSAVSDMSSFIQAVQARLKDLVVMTHSHVEHRPRFVKEAWEELEESVNEARMRSKGSSNAPGRAMPPTSWRRHARVALRCAQKYSIPLVSGVIIALVWSNIDMRSYHNFAHHPLVDFKFLGHELNLHFLVNDIFMCFFFGLAIKEVTEALLPGGSLSPLRRAANPLIATVGGVVGPIAVYCVAVLLLDAMGSFDNTTCVTEPGAQVSHRLLLESSGGGKHERCPLSVLMKGWGVPTATDISLAWMFALLIFGAGHPAINFLLLLAIVDDALGMIIIAVFYPDPEHDVEPWWLLLCLSASALALFMRWFGVERWWLYIFLGGPISWFGLIKAHMHPALALVFVVPFLPGSHARLQHSKSERHLVRFHSVKNLYRRGASNLRTSTDLSVNMVRNFTRTATQKMPRPSHHRGHRTCRVANKDMRSVVPAAEVQPQGPAAMPQTGDEDELAHVADRQVESDYASQPLTSPPVVRTNSISSLETMETNDRRSGLEIMAELVALAECAPLHEFEHAMKLPVDLGMFCFGLCNAGVQFESVGGITVAIAVALCLGKALGIAGFSCFAIALGFALPGGITLGELWIASALGGVGLTVALFVANQAFVDAGLRGQAKIGAVISVFSAVIACGIRYFTHGSTVCGRKSKVGEAGLAGQAFAEDEPGGPEEKQAFPSETSCHSGGSEGTDWIDDLLVEDVLQALWVQQRYKAHGTVLTFPEIRRTQSKDRQMSSSKEAPSASKPAKMLFGSRTMGAGQRSQPSMPSSAPGSPSAAASFPPQTASPKGDARKSFRSNTLGELARAENGRRKCRNADAYCSAPPAPPPAAWEDESIAPPGDAAGDGTISSPIDYAMPGTASVRLSGRRSISSR